MISAASSDALADTDLVVQSLAGSNGPTGKDDRMTTTLPTSTDKQAAPSPWAVETHGLTKRFGENVAVNGVELLVPEDVPSATWARTGQERQRSSGYCSD